MKPRSEIRAEQNEIAIRTEYPATITVSISITTTSMANPASVEYTITVPRQARLDEIKTGQRAARCAGCGGRSPRSCVNGRIQAHNCKARWS